MWQIKVYLAKKFLKFIWDQENIFDKNLFGQNVMLYKNLFTTKKVGLPRKWFKRKKIFENLDLSDHCREYFKRVFNAIEWESILYEGKWEKTFKTLSIILRTIMGKDFDAILKFHDLDEQRLYFKNGFSQKTNLLILNYLWYLSGQFWGADSIFQIRKIFWAEFLCQK